MAISSRFITRYPWSSRRIPFHQAKEHQRYSSHDLLQTPQLVKLKGSDQRQMTTSTGQDMHFIPRRTLMFVPGHDPKKLKKIPLLGVDCAVLECEDGVAINMKEVARKNCKDALLDDLKIQVRNLDLALRVNSVSSGLMEDDLLAVVGNSLGEPLGSDLLPQTILVPKVDTVQDLDVFTEMLMASKLGRFYVPRFLFFTESAVGLMNLRDILEKAWEHSRNGHYMLDGVVFGSDDFCADIGAVRTKDAKELIYARQKVVSFAKAFKLQAIDMVHIDIKDVAGLKVISEEGARMGFTGKQTIHPSQVSVINQAFTPSNERVQWATDLVQGFQQHQQDGQGAFVFRGQMIDMPLLKQAQNVLEIASKINNP